MQPKYIIRVVDKFSIPKSSSQPQWKTVERTKEFTNITDCLDCIKTTVAPCGQSSGEGSRYESRAFETVLVEVLAGRDLVFSSESTDFWEESTHNEIRTSCQAKISSNADFFSCNNPQDSDHDTAMSC